MKTNRSNIMVASFALASSLITFDARGQTGVWILRDTNGWGEYLASSADGTKLVATSANRNSIHTSTDSGVTWTLRNSDRGWSYVASSADGTKLAAEAVQGYIWLSSDSGVSWSSPYNPSATIWAGLASSADGSKLAAIYATYGVYTSTNSGATWTSRSLGGNPNLDGVNSVASSTDGTKLVVGTDDHIFTSTDSGVTWTAHAGEGDRYWGGVASSADGTKLVALDTGYVNAGVGYIYTSTDSGVTWIPRKIGTNWSQVASSADGTKLVAAQGAYGSVKGLLYLSTDSGVTWTVSGPAVNLGWAAVASSADGNKLVAADQSGYIYTYVAPVVNDLCSGAIALSSGVTYSMDTTYATSTGDPTPTCPSSFGRGVWFTYTPTGTGPVLISTCESTFDTVLQVYSGTCGALAAVICNDDNGPACSGNRASLSFSGAAGTTYYILAGGWNGNAGTLQIVAQLLNDQCSGAIALTDSVSYSMSTADATSTGDATPACAGSASKGVWFTYTPPMIGAVTVSTCGSSYDTVLQIMTGTCGFLVARECVDDSPACGAQAQLTFLGTSGTAYRILVAGNSGASGNLSITASSAPLKIKTQPVGGSAYAGDSFTFTVDVVAAFPPSYQWQQAGSNIAGATNSTLPLADLSPADGGDYRVIVNNISGAETSSVARLDVDPALALALDTTGLTWTTGGGSSDYGWFRQTDVSQDGVDSAECGSPQTSSPYSTAWMQTSVTGPGTLDFYWMFYVSLQSRSRDYLGFFMDGVDQARIASFFASWFPQTIYVGAGSHTLKWSYVRAGSFHGGGPGYVDQVGFTAGATAALIDIQPGPQTAVAGTTAYFSVQAGGTPPLRYQWRFNGANLAGATDSSLTLTNVMPVQAGNYSVVVTNDYGPSMTSSNAALTVTTIPLAEALDYGNPGWTTSGNALWFGQVGQTHDGVDAARSGAITNYQQSVLSLNLLGPGTLSFWWKVSSETNYDYLMFLTNSTLQKVISGEVDWQQQTVSLPAGMNTVVWYYAKDISINQGQDAAWVDQVSYDGPPYLAISPLTDQQVMLFWPTSATGFGLQYATNLAPSPFWQPVADVPAVLGDSWVVTNNAVSCQFYRLKK